MSDTEKCNPNSEMNALKYRMNVFEIIVKNIEIWKMMQKAKNLLYLWKLKQTRKLIHLSGY